jgi:two-component system response regulator (stage 0 sporulation protein F)
MIKILTIDDEPGICFLIRDAFEPIGFTVLSANNGQEALSIVRKEKPKLIFLDIRMAGMSGLEVLKEIKAIDSTLKVIMLTVIADEATRAKAKELGADDFVSKPFMSDRLEEVARKEIAEIRKERQVQQPKILVVDDEEDVRERLVKLISRRFFCEVDKAGNGQEALDKLRARKFDLVVLDIRMPGLSGIDVIQEAVKFTPETRFLAVSAYDSNEIADQALKAGAVDFIHKPQTVEGIQRKVKEVLKKIGKYEPKGP